MRMYYLHPREPYVLKERFLFSLASIINCMFSERYRIAILPARMESKHLEDIPGYTVISGNTSKHINPPAWFLSGLMKSDDPAGKENFKDSLYIQCTGTHDMVIGAECGHISSFLDFVWAELEKNQLVLFDGNVLFRLLT